MMSDECPTTASHVHQIHTSHLGSAALAAAANREPAASVAGAGASNSSMHNISFGEQHVVTTRTSMPSLRAVDVARIENHWRQVYAEKLRGATQGITTALSAELPRDHIFVQLMSDPLTHQFCKIRLGEVVETYLYSVQAHQYHNLAAEVSRLDMELCRLSAENEELHQHVEWLTVERDDAHRNNTTTSHAAPTALTVATQTKHDDTDHLTLCTDAWTQCEETKIPVMHVAQCQSDQVSYRVACTLTDDEPRTCVSSASTQTPTVDTTPEVDPNYACQLQLENAELRIEVLELGDMMLRLKADLEAELMSMQSTHKTMLDRQRCVHLMESSEATARLALSMDNHCDVFSMLSSFVTRAQDITMGESHHVRDEFGVQLRQAQEDAAARVSACLALQEEVSRLVTVESTLKAELAAATAEHHACAESHSVATATAAQHNDETLASAENRVQRLQDECELLRAEITQCRTALDVTTLAKDHAASQVQLLEVRLREQQEQHDARTKELSAVFQSSMGMLQHELMALRSETAASFASRSAATDSEEAYHSQAQLLAAARDDQLRLAREIADMRQTMQNMTDTNTALRRELDAMHSEHAWGAALSNQTEASLRLDHLMMQELTQRQAIMVEMNMQREEAVLSSFHTHVVRTVLNERSIQVLSSAEATCRAVAEEEAHNEILHAALQYSASIMIELKAVSKRLHNASKAAETSKANDHDIILDLNTREAQLQQEIARLSAQLKESQSAVDTLTSSVHELEDRLVKTSALNESQRLSLQAELTRQHEELVHRAREREETLAVERDERQRQHDLEIESLKHSLAEAEKATTLLSLSRDNAEALVRASESRLQEQQERHDAQLKELSASFQMSIGALQAELTLLRSDTCASLATRQAAITNAEEDTKEYMMRQLSSAHDEQMRLGQENADLRANALRSAETISVMAQELEVLQAEHDYEAQILQQQYLGMRMGQCLMHETVHRQALGLEILTVIGEEQNRFLDSVAQLRAREEVVAAEKHSRQMVEMANLCTLLSMTMELVALENTSLLAMHARIEHLVEERSALISAGRSYTVRETELNAEIQRLSNDMAFLQCKHNEAAEMQQSMSREALCQLKATHEATLLELTVEHEQTAAAAQQAHQEAVQVLETRLHAMQGSLNEAEQRLALVEAQYQKQITEWNAQHSKELMTTMQSSIASMQHEAESWRNEVAALTTQSQQSLTRTHEVSVEWLQQRLDEHQSEQNRLQQENSDLAVQLTATMAQLTAVSNEKDILQQSLTTLRDEFHEISQRCYTLYDVLTEDSRWVYADDVDAERRQHLRTQHEAEVSEDVDRRRSEATVAVQLVEDLIASLKQQLNDGLDKRMTELGASIVVTHSAASEELRSMRENLLDLVLTSSAQKQGNRTEEDKESHDGGASVVKQAVDEAVKNFVVPLLLNSSPSPLVQQRTPSPSRNHVDEEERTHINAIGHFASPLSTHQVAVPLDSDVAKWMTELSESRSAIAIVREMLKAVVSDQHVPLTNQNPKDDEGLGLAESVLPLVREVVRETLHLRSLVASSGAQLHVLQAEAISLMAKMEAMVSSHSQEMVQSVAASLMSIEHNLIAELQHAWNNYGSLVSADAAESGRVEETGLIRRAIHSMFVTMSDRFEAESKKASLVEVSEAKHTLDEAHAGRFDVLFERQHDLLGGIETCMQKLMDEKLQVSTAADSWRSTVDQVERLVDGEAKQVVDLQRLLATLQREMTAMEALHRQDVDELRAEYAKMCHRCREEERRNAVLHERCAEKEKMLALLRADRHSQQTTRFPPPAMTNNDSQVKSPSPLAHPLSSTWWSPPSASEPRRSPALDGASSRLAATRKYVGVQHHISSSRSPAGMSPSPYAAASAEDDSSLRSPSLYKPSHTSLTA